MISPEDRVIVERWFHDLFGRGDLAVLDEIVAPDLVTHDAAGTDKGHDLVGDGEKIAVRYSGWVTNRGGLLNIPSKSQRVQEMGILIFRVRDGKVHELWSALADLELVLSLGAVPVVPEGGDYHGSVSGLRP